jgi:hypothetical protein
MVARWRRWTIKVVVLGFLGGSSWETGRLAVEMHSLTVGQAIAATEVGVRNVWERAKACSLPRPH